MLGFLIFVSLASWFVLQFRPARRPVWEQRWTKQWRPFGLAMRALTMMAWQGFIRDPAARLWRWGSARQESKHSRRTLDDALDRLLGREP